MSETPPPPPPHGATPPPPPFAYSPPPPPYGYPAPSPKKRPSAWWFLPGSIALLIAIACIVYAVMVGVGLFKTDGYVTADGTASTVELQRSGQRMLFAEVGGPAPDCVVTENGSTLAVDPVDESDPESLDVDGGTWVPQFAFTADGTTVQVTCTGNGESVRVGAPAGESEFIRIGVSSIAALGFGLIGVIGLIVITVLYVSRRPRKVA